MAGKDVETKISGDVFFTGVVIAFIMAMAVFTLVNVVTLVF